VNPASAGDFSLSASPTSRTVFAGGQTTYTVNITRSGGFGGGVSLSTGTLPSGATATFSPNPATGASSTLTLRTSGNTPRGTYNIVITGTNGSLRHTTTVSLTVTFGD
jgi:serine protease AprX